VTVDRKEGWSTPAEVRDISPEMKARLYKVVDNLEWEPHPLNENVKLKMLLTKKDDGVEVTCLVAKIPKGQIVPEHTHEVHDVLYPLSGEGKVWIKGLGDFEMKPGVIVNVPPRALHKVYDVIEELTVYDVFSGPII
jgi:quercetin dioxygenase-like cupin family protein